MKKALFDLDGTITASGEGIKKGAAFALNKIKVKAIPEDKLDFFIGPPLKDCFTLCNVSEDKLDEAIFYFRSYYEKQGKYESYVYDGIVDLFSSLKEKNYKIFVCTSKGRGLALDIIRHFDLLDYIDDIYGALYDGSKAKKGDIIKQCLDEYGYEQSVMIGDTYLDINGAKENHIPSIGVSYGYGDKMKLVESLPNSIVNNVFSLYQVITSIIK